MAPEGKTPSRDLGKKNPPPPLVFLFFFKNGRGVDGFLCSLAVRNIDFCIEIPANAFSVLYCYYCILKTNYRISDNNRQNYLKSRFASKITTLFLITKKNNLNYHEHMKKK